MKKLLFKTTIDFEGVLSLLLRACEKLLCEIEQDLLVRDGWSQRLLLRDKLGRSFLNAFVLIILRLIFLVGLHLTKSLFVHMVIIFDKLISYLIYIFIF